MSNVCTRLGAKGKIMNNKVDKQIGQNIKRIRESVGYTQEYVSIKLQLAGCDITRSAYAKIEVGQRHLYVDEIILLKNIFNVKYDDIFQLIK